MFEARSLRFKRRSLAGVSLGVAASSEDAIGGTAG